MDNGWIKLYRRSIDSRVFQNEGLLKVWIWCLLKANHSTQWVSLKTGKGIIEVECKDGQFIFGRDSAAKELKMNASTVWKRMNKLKNIGNLDIESNRQYSTVTVMKWDIYQNDKIKSNSKSNRQVTGKGQASNTNKNVNNEKNKNIYSKFPELNIESWAKWISYKKQTRSNYKTENGEITKIKELIKISGSDNAIQDKIIQQSIDEEWKGLFPLKEDRQKPKEPYRVMTGLNDEDVELYSQEEVDELKALLAKAADERTGPQ